MSKKRKLDDIYDKREDKMREPGEEDVEANEENAKVCPVLSQSAVPHLDSFYPSQAARRINLAIRVFDKRDTEATEKIQQLEKRTIKLIKEKETRKPAMALLKRKLEEVQPPSQSRKRQKLEDRFNPDDWKDHVRRLGVLFSEFHPEGDAAISEGEQFQRHFEALTEVFCSTKSPEFVFPSYERWKELPEKENSKPMCLYLLVWGRTCPFYNPRWDRKHGYCLGVRRINGRTMTRISRTRVSKRTIEVPAAEGLDMGDRFDADDEKDEKDAKDEGEVNSIRKVRNWLKKGSGGNAA
ncbi:hypothetical protein HYALB_00012614 [Hymenoscyphus albidus]|uniref:Uncharacterized protein n=1 Tax=Hymenoscyphus albidus TaxID=595503 RepID=A0A9N9Q9X7_9HELO|nr:hypothetical protein HYALB_00012614 [Hymenoscyphus albidus]